MIGTVWEVQFTDEDFHIDLLNRTKSSTKNVSSVQGGLKEGT